MLNGPLTQQQRNDHQRWQANYEIGQKTVRDREDLDRSKRDRAKRFAYEEDQNSLRREGLPSETGLFPSLFYSFVGLMSVLAILPSIGTSNALLEQSGE